MDGDICSTGADTATKQAVNKRDERGRFMLGNAPTAGFHTNPERRSNGSWAKVDSPRYKLEQMMTYTEAELLALFDNEDTPLFEMRLAQAILDGTWPVLRDIMNEVYGRPKESIDILSGLDSQPIVRGFVLPSLPGDFIDNLKS